MKHLYEMTNYELEEERVRLTEVMDKIEDEELLEAIDRRIDTIDDLLDSRDPFEED